MEDPAPQMEAEGPTSSGGLWQLQRRARVRYLFRPGKRLPLPHRKSEPSLSKYFKTFFLLVCVLPLVVDYHMQVEVVRYLRVFAPPAVLERHVSHGVITTL